MEASNEDLSTLPTNTVESIANESPEKVDVTHKVVATLSQSPQAPLQPSPERTLTAHAAKTPEEKIRYRLQEAMMSEPRHRDYLRRAIEDGERYELPEDELHVARAILEEEDRKYDAYTGVRYAMQSEDPEQIRNAVQAGLQAGLKSEDVGQALAMLSDEDFLLARVKDFNTSLEIKHSSPTARDSFRSTKGKLMMSSQSLPELKSQTTTQSDTPSQKQPTKERFNGLATEADVKLGFLFSGTPQVVTSIEPKGWADRNGVKVDDEVDALNGVPVADMDKKSIMEALKQRPVSIAFTREIDTNDAVLNQIKEHILKKHGPKALQPKKRHPAMAWNGRVSGMSLQDYRERKWSVDACYAKVERRGSSFSMRAALPSHLGKKTGHQDLFLDVLRSYNTTLKRVPSYSCALQYHPVNADACPGPGEYDIAHTMDPNKHPTAPKHTGPRFGTEVLNPRDPTGPAPGDYDPNAIIHSSAIKRSATIVIQGREAWRPRTEAPGPGVGEYKYEQAMRTGKLTPLHYSISHHLSKPVKQSGIGPGPPHYYRSPGCNSETGENKHPSTAHLKFNTTKSQAPIWKFGSEPRGLRRD